jgi:peptidoglycan/LPS O-acetylase OafA/YrhL
MSQNRVLPSLTPLRGVAALWVVLYHYNIWATNLNLDDYFQIVDQGYLAVDLFFMISGFVMAHVYWRSFQDGLRGNYWPFLGARMARLYPLQIFLLLLFLATALSAQTAAYVATGVFKPIPLEGARSLVALLANLFMLQGLKATALSWNYPSWSISIECMAYLFFPLALTLLWRASTSAKIVVGGIIVATLIALRQLTGDNFNQWDGVDAFIRCLPEFVAGMLLYDLYCAGAGRRLLASDLTAVTVWLAALALMRTGLSDFLAVLIFPLLLLVSVANRGFVTKVINITPLIWLGEISYSLYLVHGFVQFAVARLLDAEGIDIDDMSQGHSALLIAAMLIASFAIAALTHATVERAGRQRLRRAFGLVKPAAAAA